MSLSCCLPRASCRPCSAARAPLCSLELHLLLWQSWAAAGPGPVQELQSRSSSSSTAAAATAAQQAGAACAGRGCSLLLPWASVQALLPLLLLPLRRRKGGRSLMLCISALQPGSPWRSRLCSRLSSESQGTHRGSAVQWMQSCRAAAAACRASSQALPSCASCLQLQQLQRQQALAQGCCRGSACRLSGCSWLLQR